MKPWLMIGKSCISMDKPARLIQFKCNWNIFILGQSKRQCCWNNTICSVLSQGNKGEIRWKFPSFPYFHHFISTNIRAASAQAFTGLSLGYFKLICFLSNKCSNLFHVVIRCHFGVKITVSRLNQNANIKTKCNASTESYGRVNGAA